MRTSAEQEIRCTFLGHNIMLNSLWEYDEKQTSSSMEIHTFPNREIEALGGG